MSAPIHVLPVYTQPVGAPPKDSIWDTLLGQWIKNSAAEQVEAYITKRPPGATPKGKVWDYINGLWIDKPPGLRSGSKLDPAPTYEEWNAMKETYVWTNKRLVHIWEMPFGWDFFTFNYQTLRAESWSSFSFMGAQGRCTATTWNLKNSAQKGEWVIIQKGSK